MTLLIRGMHRACEFIEAEGRVEVGRGGGWGTGSYCLVAIRLLCGGRRRWLFCLVLLCCTLEDG